MNRLQWIRDRYSAAGALLVALVLVAQIGCGGDDAPFEVRESVEQLQVTHAEPGATLELVDGDGDALQSVTVDDLGSAIFRNVASGEGYAVRGAGEVSDLTVMSPDDSLPAQAFYDAQVLEPGFGYIETRDGTRLSVYVQLPGPVEDGPYPTLVNYSGYSPSRPGAPVDSVPSVLCADLPVLCDAPDHPSGLIAGVMGFATVGVNMRGTGCSGGAYDFFETLQLLDGYDVIETVAAQSWVKGNKVGMAGLSFPGISQLFVASTRPPSLAAITPLSVIADVQSTMVPGGLLNDGFAINWSQRVLDSAAPYGQGWEQERVDEGDEICAENQLLHGQKVDIVEKAYANPFYDPAVADPLNLNLLVRKIDVPIFLAGAWQDEQTGPGFASLLDKFDSSPQVRMTVYNGVHPDGYTPQVLAEWHNFLSFHVKEEIPVISNLTRALAAILFSQEIGANLELPDDRFADAADLATARAAYDAEEPLRVIFENGGAEGVAVGAPQGAWETAFAAWPPAQTKTRRLFFHPDGTLQDDAPTEVDSASKFTHDPAEGQRSILKDGGDIWALLPEWDWPQHDAGRAIVFESQELAENLVVLGFGSVDLWVRSTADDADIEVTISEVRPDGQEMYVQSGWLRASLAALAEDATELRPTKTFRESDVALLPDGEWKLVRVEMSAFGHVFRASSRIRLSIDTPGASRAEWRFALKEYPAGTEVSVSHSAANPSSIVLPVIPDLAVPTALPACPSLRAQPCRAHQSFTNTPVE